MNSFTAPLDYTIEAEPLWSALDIQHYIGHRYKVSNNLQHNTHIFNAENW